MYISPAEYPTGLISSVRNQVRGRGNQRTRKERCRYKDVLVAFDIETTRLPDIEQSIMYVWQLHIHHHCTIIGRTWAELDELLRRISDELRGDERLVIWVHNLSYEFQFLRALHEWESFEVFALDKRKVCKATWTERKLEFRCSYIHSNMSLSEFTTKMGAEHRKLSGEEYDYSTVRYPWTPLTERELEYCAHDVIGLCEALEIEMEQDGDNLYTVPPTSTGYVRRDAKRALRNVSHQLLTSLFPTYEQYLMLREAFRGGNTHGNRYYSCAAEEYDGTETRPRTLYGVKSADRSSSYPDEQCNRQFPMSPFCPVQKPTFDYIVYLIEERGKAVLMRIAMSGVRLRDRYWGCPYIPLDKCRRCHTYTNDNGRIIAADYLEITITDIDLKIILSEYDADDITVIDAYYARYGMLPDPLTAETKRYYRDKTELKGVDGKEVYYTKQKNKLNSIYGMQATDPCKQSVTYRAGEWDYADDDPREVYAKSKPVMPYQWGVWVTAHARYDLELGLRLAHGYSLEGKPLRLEHPPRFVYCDTDSVKYIGNIDWRVYNQRAQRRSRRTGACARDPHGAIHYMGVFEDDGYYAEFRQMGAKKYAYRYERGGATHVTIAGVTKSKGGAELDAHGGLDAFREGFTFHDAGGTESVYNDHPTNGVITREGRSIMIYPNIVIRPSTYTLGITAEYRSILTGCSELDFWG